MNYFKEYEARRKLYKNIRPGSLWRWNDDIDDATDDDISSWLRVIKVECNTVYYRYEYPPDYPISFYLEGTHCRNLNGFKFLASPFVPVIELAQ